MAFDKVEVQIGFLGKGVIKLKHESVQQVSWTWHPGGTEYVRAEASLGRVGLGAGSREERDRRQRG